MAYSARSSLTELVMGRGARGKGLLDRLQQECDALSYVLEYCRVQLRQVITLNFECVSGVCVWCVWYVWCGGVMNKLQ